MPFGKFKGVAIEDLDEDYLQWLDGLDDLREPLRTVVNEEMIRRDAANRLHVNRGLIPEIVEAGRRALSKRYHPDCGGSTEKMQALNNTCDWMKSRMLLVI